MPSSTTEARLQRDAIRRAAMHAGRSADEIRCIAFAGFTVGAAERRSARAVQFAKPRWSPRDIPARAVFQPYVLVVGSADQVADHLRQWFEAGAADGFITNFDDFDTGIQDFVDQVVPILRKRGPFHDDYKGQTLRDHLGLPRQYGLDPRIGIFPN